MKKSRVISIFMGARVWAWWYPLGAAVPRLELYNFLGPDPNGGVYLFERRKDKVRIGIPQGAISNYVSSGVFRPFCLDPSVEKPIEQRTVFYAD